jgi:succinate dehydrogenase / fumarate reductase iron-sulfur subunit
VARAAFPVIKDLVVDRSAFDRVIAGRWLHLGEHRLAPDANAIPVPKETPTRRWTPRVHRLRRLRGRLPERVGDAVRRAKVSHLAHLPQGQPERETASSLVGQMDAEGFGNCTNHYECEAACPKEIPRDVMALTNRDYAKAAFIHRDRENKSDGAG